MVNTALRDALTVLHPSREETHLLRACLWTGPRARDAWQAFEGEAGDLREVFRADFGRRKRLGPLVAWALRRNGLTADSRVLTVLRTASLREELRARLYQEILGAVQHALGGAGLPFLVTRGAALGSTLYETPSLRHSHDIDLILRRDDLEGAAAALGAAGFRRTPSPGPFTDGVEVTHPTTLPVNLRATLFEGAGAGPGWELLWSRRRAADLPGGPAAVLAPADELLGVLGHAGAGGHRANLQWACDAWLLVPRIPDSDWESFLTGTAAAGATLSCWALVSYLATALDAPIPRAVVAALTEAAGRVPALERDRALYAARSSTGAGTIGLLRRGASLRARGTLLRWLLLPSPAYLRAAYGVEGRGQLPMVYLKRLFRYGRSVLRGRPAAPSVRSSTTAVE